MAKIKRFGEFLEDKKQKNPLMNVKDGIAGDNYQGDLATKINPQPKEEDRPKAGTLSTADKDQVGMATLSTPGMNPSEPLSLSKDTSEKVKFKKLTAEEFRIKTRDMNDAEFAKFILESHGPVEISTVTDLFGNEFTPDPLQSIEYVCGLMLGNPVYMERFIREIKRHGGLQEMMRELMEHNDTFETMIGHMEEPIHGMEHIGKFAKVLNEKHMKNYDNFDFGDEDLEESVSPGIDQMAPKPKGVFGAHTADPYTATPGRGLFGPKGVMGQSGGPAPMNQPAPGAQPQAAPAPNFGGAPVMPPKKMSDGSFSKPKFKGNSVGLSLVKEMTKYPHFKNHMTKCVGPECDN